MGALFAPTQISVWRENRFICQFNRISTWWKSNPKLKDHENSATHQEAFLKWKELEMRLKAGMTVDSLGQNKINNVRKKWAQTLHRVVDMM